jgi:hypothetical protein
MRTRLAVAFLALGLCMLLIFVTSPSSGQCGPGNAGCGGGCPANTYCEGVGCAVPGNYTLSPGYCTSAQKAAGGYEIFGSGNCGNDRYGGCICYLPQDKYQITRNCYIKYP